MSDEQDLAELREATERTDRASAGADAPQEDGADLVDAIAAELEAVEDGDRQKTVSVWDGPLAAFAAALENDEDARQALGEGLAEAFDLEDTPTDRATLLRLSLRLGVREASPDQYDAVREAVRRRAERDM